MGLLGEFPGEGFTPLSVLLIYEFAGVLEES